ncbi:hypothetical protein QJS10_CPA16g00372 [Acorus calamus]|uniref:RNase H type-1 domain-containing protein n=1 Tax=Acorus calamus TaxID=4465 RepID=A0AAV9D5U2_ACOCL|nr:hypothetical protein QJS10_CPA16g00372 [Acorus calamus]
MAFHWGPTESTLVSKLINNGKWSTSIRWPSTHLEVWEDITRARVGGTRADIHIWMGSKDTEDVDHLFFRCGYSSFIWLSLLAKIGLPRNASHTLLAWVEILYQLHLQPAMLKVVKVIFATTIGLIWKERCSHIFHSQSRHKSPLLLHIIETAVLRLSKQPLYAEPCSEVEKTERNLGIIFTTKTFQDIFFAWDPRPDSWVKCNSDGSLSDDRVGFGALLHDSQGQFLIGQTSLVPLASINHLELLGVKSGALLCLQLNLDKGSGMGSIRGRLIETSRPGRGG